MKNNCGIEYTSSPDFSDEVRSSAHISYTIVSRFSGNNESFPKSIGEGEVLMEWSGILWVWAKQIISPSVSLSYSGSQWRPFPVPVQQIAVSWSKLPWLVCKITLMRNLGLLFKWFFLLRMWDWLSLIQSIFRQFANFEVNLSAPVIIALIEDHPTLYEIEHVENDTLAWL